MKKFLCVLCVLVVGATSFAANGKFGLDFSWGLNLGFQNMGMTDSDSGVEGKLKRTDLALPIVRVSSYNFFLLDNMLGVFASANISAGLQFGDKLVSDGGEVKGAGVVGSISDAFLGLEFMVGPSFGIDINENLRFQTGLGFHYLFEKSLMETMMDMAIEGEEMPSISLHSFGLALTPQLRFSPSKKTSFILGCDFLFDFGRGKASTVFGYEYENRPTENGTESGTEFEEIPADAIDKYFRFGMSPYIGVGINF